MKIKIRLLLFLKALATVLLLALQLGKVRGTVTTSTSTSGQLHHVLKGTSQSLYFDGVAPGATQQGTYYKSQPLVSESLEEVTIHAWVKIERHKRYNWLAGTVNRVSGWALFVDEAEKACFGLFIDKQLKTISTRSLQLPKAWHFVSGVFKNGTIQVFVDAQPGEVVPLSHRTLSNAIWKEGIYLGGSPAFPSLRLHGELGSVQLWDKARTSEQIAKDMMTDYSQSCSKSNGSRGGLMENGLVAFWHMACSAQGESASADIIKEMIRRQDFEMKGLGAEPRWRFSTMPIYLPAFVEAEPGPENELQFSARISAEKHDILSFTVDRMKSKLSLEAYVEKEILTNETLGKVPELPWPILPNRSIRFLLRYDAEKEYSQDDNICAHLKLGVIQESSYLASQTVYLVLMHPSKPATSSEIVESCHFAGRDQTLVRLKEARRTKAFDLSLLFFLFESDLEPSLDRIGDFMKSFPQSLSLECFVFKIGEGKLTHEIKKLRLLDEQKCSIYTVTSVEQALRISQAVASSSQMMVSTIKSTQMLPSNCSDILDLALGGYDNPNEQSMFSLIPSQGYGDVLACSAHEGPENGTESRVQCERMEQRAFAGTVVSALGGLPKWWALFIPNSITFMKTDFLRFLWIEDLPELDNLDLLGGGFPEMRMMFAVWRMYVRMLQAYHAWEEPRDGEKGGSLSYLHHVYRNTKETVDDQRQLLELSELLLALQKMVA